MITEEVKLMGVKRLSEGKYLIDITWTDSKEGRQRLRRQFFGTLKAAKKVERKMINEARLGHLQPREAEVERTGFKDFAWEWFDTYVKANNGEAEQNSKETYLRIHLVPFFGKMYLDEIGRREIEGFKAVTVEKGLSPASVNHYLKCLQKLFECALEWGVVDKNPVKGVPRLKVDRDKWDFLDFEEAEKFMAAVPPVWQPLFLCAIRTGMRQGELLALQHEDIDMKRRVMYVRWSLSRTGKLKAPKSGKGRAIPIALDLFEVLFSIRNNGSKFVFPAQDGGAMHGKTLDRPLRTTNKNSGVKRIRFHDLRHCFASHLVMAGVPIRTVQELLGHGDMTMTLRYAHLTPECKQEAIRILDKRVLDCKCVKIVTLEDQGR
jgi:integrase